MAFKIIEKPEFTLDVDVPGPGGANAQVLKTTFIALPEEDVETYDVRTRDGAKDLLRHVVVGFHDVELVDGKAVDLLAPGDEGFEALIALPNLRIAVNNAYQIALAGVKGPRRGN